jgi:hypothetical protein
MNNNTNEQWVFLNNISTPSPVNEENGDAPPTQTVEEKEVADQAAGQKVN